jgi:hypothetical protein
MLEALGVLLGPGDEDVLVVVQQLVVVVIAVLLQTIQVPESQTPGWLISMK